MGNSLNEQQLSVVNCIQGPLQVIAGAGSGKTTVLMHRTKNIIEQKLASPKEVLLVTFTKKAAEELKERITVLYGEKGKDVSAGTFHSICLQKILKVHADETFLESVGLNANWEGMDNSDQSSIVKQAMKEMLDEDIDYCKVNEINSRKFEAFLSLVRSMGIEKDKLKETRNKAIESKDLENPLYSIGSYFESEGIPDYEIFEDIALRFWERYEQICRSKNAIDFDDILLLTSKLLNDKPEIAEKLSQDWKYIMLDEYQDTNTVQMNIMDSISKYHKNICVVGDDQQSIYAFRGSNINVIRGFKDRYPDCKMLNLSKNYRSSAEILKVSNNIASAMTKRLSNEFLESPINKHSKTPTLRAFNNVYEESNFIANDIKNKIREGVSPNDIAILYRNRSVKQNIEKEFLNKDIQYHIYNDISFFSRKEVQDVVAMIRFIFRPWSALSAIRFLDGANLPVSGEIILKNAERDNVSPHNFMEKYAKGSTDILNKNNNNYMTLYQDSIKAFELFKEDHIKNKEEIKDLLSSTDEQLNLITSKIDNGEYPSGSIKKNDIIKAGRASRKIIRALKNDKVNDELINDFIDIPKNIKSSVKKSNEIRMFVNTMETLIKITKLCDEKDIEKSTLSKIPKTLRNALTLTWETYMASSLEKYAKQITNSEKDADNLEARYKNIEYILDRFAEKIKEAISNKEKNDMNFSSITDFAIDDLVMLIDQSPSDNANEKVQMMTMHASKGLEFPHVYVIGMSDDVMPGKAIESVSQTQEELRLFYVACTRAKDNLSISFPAQRRAYDGSIINTKPSPFLRNVINITDYYKRDNQNKPSNTKVKEVNNSFNYSF